jgi:4-methyl-5(b-hydroxyethyl)-thiazole monophosphate biosynthesis
MKSARILISVPDGAEEIETIMVADLAVRAGCAVTLAGHQSTTPTGSRGLPMRCDTLFADAAEQRWDAVYFPGGLPAAEFHRDNPTVQNLLRDRLAAQQLTAIICASPMALMPGGLCHNRRLTSYPSLKEDLQKQGAHWLDEPVIRDGPLLTSQGPGTAAELGLALAALLTDASNAATIASAALMTEAWRAAQAALAHPIAS